MRIPLSWLREFAQVPAEASAEDVMAELVKVGFEEEAVHRPTDTLGPIVVGQVLSIVKEPQTNGKTINWCQVRVVPEGREQTLTGEGIDPSGVQGIICGAHNFVDGDKVVVTLPGAVLPGDFPIAARKTYGHTSDGMIASARELGLGEEHDGILRLSRSGSTPELGADAIDLLGLDDAGRRDQRHARPRATHSRSAGGPRVPHSPDRRSATRRSPSRFRSRPHGGYGVTIDDEAPIRGKPRLARLRDPSRARCRRDPTDPAVDGGAPVARRDAIHLAAGRHHQLRDARARPADPRVRPRQAHRRHRGAARRGGRRWTAEQLETLDGDVRTLWPKIC